MLGKVKQFVKVWMPVQIGVILGALLVSGLIWTKEEPHFAEALNVVGGEVITRSETDADFTIIKGRGDIDTLVQVQASVINGGLRGTDRNSGDSIARDASAALQFLVNSYQTLAEILDENGPCPSSPQEWEDLGGGPGGTVPNPEAYPNCDPDVLFDPARCSLYWDDLDPNIDHPVIVGEPKETQVSRVVIPSLTWDGATYTMRLADPSRNPDNYPNNC